MSGDGTAAAVFTGRSAFSGFSSDDIEAAKAFYGGKLGLDATEEHGMLSLRFPGGQRVVIYPKDDHEAATFTVLNLEVEDIEKAVDGLTAAGIDMERYGSEFDQDARGISRMSGGPPIAWFRDPAGNILSVIETERETSV
jgi:catechol 2,3-dioxygenase-like lactoylglutathione lyase family enzyme